MEKTVKTCCFTGHRPGRLPWLEQADDERTVALRRALWQRIEESYLQGYTRFLTGMAQGVDLLCAELVLQLREENHDVELVPVLPYSRQAYRWRADQRKRYRTVLKACTEDIVIIAPEYTRNCFALRNQYLVDHSGRVIGVYDGVRSGGTFQTLEYARKQGLEMILILPG